MHFAYPPRKSSHPPAYLARGQSRSLSYSQRRQLKIGAIILCSLVFFILVFSRLSTNGPERIQPGTPEVVIVTLIDEENMSKDYIAKVQDNRKDYAARHGMFPAPFPPISNFFPRLTTKRLHNLLPYHLLLPFHRRLPPLLGPRPRPPARLDSLPTKHLFLRPLPTRPNHEPNPQPP